MQTELWGVPAGIDFGKRLTLHTTSDFADVVAHPENYVGKPILLSGRISDVCQRKGCWTVLSLGNAHVRVRFEDYGFFLPTDSSGEHAYVEGFVKADGLSEREAAHYAAESGSTPLGSTSERREVQFTASGVRLTSSPSAPAGS